MNLSLHSLCFYLEGFLQLKFLNDYCPNGLQIEGRAEVGKIATAVSASLETIEVAVSLGVDALIVHHGLFWNRDAYSITGVKRKKIALLLQHQISLLAYHLPLDKSEAVGNNWQAARDLGWSELEPFGFYNGSQIGVSGKFKEKELDEFIKELETYYGHLAHVAAGGKQKVESAALISGGAHKDISQAVEAKIDCFITGSFDEPIWNQAFEEKINFLALGHSATEKIGVKTLGKHLFEKFQLEHHFIDSDNPF